MDKTFLPSQQYPGYLVSADGEVRHERLQRTITPRRNNYGTLVVKLRHPNGYGFTHTPLARMVASRYSIKHQPCMGYGHEPDLVVHKNLDQDDCRADNLVWRYRFYAMKYHRLADEPSWMNPFHEMSANPNTSRPIVEQNSQLRSETGVGRFAQMFGLLPYSIYLAALINTPGTEEHDKYGSVEAAYAYGHTQRTIMETPGTLYSFWLMNHYGKGLHFTF